MKYIIGAAVGLLLAVGGVAIAATQGAVGLVRVESIENIVKYYDRDANVICYRYMDINSAGISCLKNN